MADFCLQCSVKVGAPEGWTDFPGADEGTTYSQVCEGCGIVWIGERGECLGIGGNPWGPCPEGHTRPVGAGEAQP